MDHIEYSLKLISEVDMESGIENEGESEGGSEEESECDNEDCIRTFNIITVHGLGSMDSEEAAFPWQEKGNKTPTADISAFLSFNDAKSRSLTFRYSIPRQQRNIDVDDVHLLARALLDALVSLKDDKSIKLSGDFVLVGRDLGGLIIKQALSLARWIEKYHFLAAQTTALIFFETPHWAIPTETSWENLANWLLSISQWKCLSSVDWIYGTAHMIESICGDFEGSQRLYDVINVTTAPVLDAGWERKVNELCWSTVRFETDLSNAKEAMETICQKIISSTRPGMAFIRSLRTLATMALARLHNETPLDLRGRTSEDVVDTHSEIRKWNSGTGGTIYLVPAPGDDPSILLTKLVAAQSTGESNMAVLSYVFSSNRFEADDAMIVMASICYQLLYQKPRMFDHVAHLLDALRKLDEDGIWPANKLFILFRSLLSSPHKGKTTCILWEQPGTNFPQDVLDQLVRQADTPSASFKLAIIRSGDGEVPAESIRLPQMADLETSLDDALDVFLETRPGLQSVQSTLLSGLRSQYDVYKTDMAAHHRVTSDVFQIWLELITRLAVPVSTTSLENTLLQMPSSIDDLYAQILNQTCHFTKSQLADILAWIVLPPTQLRAAELATALALESNTKTFAELESNKPADLQVDLVAELGSVVPVFDWRRPFHTQDLVRILSDKTQDEQDFLAKAQFRLAELCLVFLRLYVAQDAADLVSSLDQHPFLWYAVSNWPVHYAKGKKASGQAEVPAVFRAFFADRSLIDFWAGMHHGIQHPGVPSISEYALPAAAEVGCLDLAQCLMEGSGDESRSAALLAAITRADLDMVTFFQAASVTSPFSLHIAVSSGLPHLLKHIVPTPEAMSTRNSLGYTPLHCACQDGTLEIVDNLLQAGADASMKSGQEMSTPLHIASMFSHISVIQRLAEKDVSGLYARDKEGQIPLDYACQYEQSEAVRAILEIPGVLETFGNDSEESACPRFFHIAASTGRVDIVEMLLGTTDMPETQHRDILDQMCTWKDADGCTALHLAAREGHVGMTKALLRQAASKLQAITMQDNKGNIPLHLASRKGHADIVELLLPYTPAEQLNARDIKCMAPLHLAVRYGHVDVVRRLVQAHVAHKVSLDLFDDYPRSALHYAALRGHEQSVQLLVENGATVGIADYDGATPLHLACRHGYEKVVSFLILKGSDLTLCDDNGKTPLLDAARAGSIAIMKSLVDAGASWKDKDKHGRNVLHHVVKSNMEAVTFVLENVQSTDAHEQHVSLADKDDNGMTAPEVAASGNMLRAILGLKQVEKDRYSPNLMLWTAAKAGRWENVEYLVTEKGASPESQDDEGRTALSLAAEEGHVKVVEFLASRTPTIVDSDGNTPLHFASDMGHTDVVSVLVATPDRSEISMTNNDHMSPIVNAVWGGHLEIVKILLEKGADPNAPVEDGILIHVAAEYGYPQIVECLLKEENIRGEEKNEYGCSPIYLAARSGEREVVMQLIKANCPANFPQSDDEGYPIHAAYNDAAIVELLITQANMDVNATNNCGRTVLHKASQNSFSDVVDVLFRHGADAWHQDKDGNTPLHLAVKVCIVEKFLANLSSNPCTDWKKIKNKKGLTVFLGALVASNVSIVEYLLEQKDGAEWIDDSTLETVVLQQNDLMMAVFKNFWTEDFLKKTDEHGWTYELVVQAVAGEDIPDGPSPDGLAKQPSCWALAEDEAALLPDPEKKDGPAVRVKYEAEAGYRALALADHPAPPRGQFYFTVRVLQEEDKIVGVGVARKNCSLDRMPGWDPDTWGLHGDDGGLFHEVGRSRWKDAEWGFGVGDEMGVFVDTREQKVFYAKNNQIINTGFKDVHGPVFPAVGLGPGCEIEATFGSPDGTDPFKDAQGVDQISKVTNWIGHGNLF